MINLPTTGSETFSSKSLHEHTDVSRTQITEWIEKGILSTDRDAGRGKSRKFTIENMLEASVAIHFGKISHIGIIKNNLEFNNIVHKAYELLSDEISGKQDVIRILSSILTNTDKAIYLNVGYITKEPQETMRPNDDNKTDDEFKLSLKTYRELYNPNLSDGDLCLSSINVNITSLYCKLMIDITRRQEAAHF